MVLSREEQKRREVLEREWRVAEKGWNQRRQAIADQIEARKRITLREGTVKVAGAHMEFRRQKEVVQKWVVRAHKQVDNEYADKVAELSVVKAQVCQATEQELGEALRVIEADEQEAIAVLEGEWKSALQRYHDLLNPETEPATLAESEGNDGETR